MNENDSIIKFLAAHRDSLLQQTIEHLLLTAVTIVSAIIIGVAFAIIAYRYKLLRAPLLALAGMLQTIPGIALLVMAMGLFGHIGTAPALFTLILYAILPIAQNTLVGLEALPPSLSEVARGIGLKPLQHLRYVRLPLAIPVIMAGVRIAAVQTVGLATLAAFIGAGGLGQFINRGLFLSDNRLILLGAIPAAIMALLINSFLSLVAVALTPHYAKTKKRLAIITILICSTLFAATITVYAIWQRSKEAPVFVTIGSKNFTEQLIIAEMVSQYIERNTNLKVKRRFGLGGSMVVHQAFTRGTIDIAVEYTGTALTSILHLPIPGEREMVFPLVRERYQEQFSLTWLPPLGFDNSYRLAIRDDDQRLKQITTTSGLAKYSQSLRAAFDFEFAERDDGYKGLKKTYNLEFAKVADMHPDLLYPALLKSSVDVISAYTTDGRLDGSHIRLLEDDLNFFPPYEASIVVSSQLLSHNPQLEQILRELSGTLNNATMRAINSKVDSKKFTIEQAASILLDN